MATRVFLSIIPSLQTPTERLYTGGFDYKTLKAAVLGAKDLIHYGTLAIGDEVGFSHRNGSADAIKIIKLAKVGQYIDAIELGIKQFSYGVDAWEPNYGGHKWLNIAKVLLDMTRKYTSLKALRNENASNARDPKRDYLNDEVQTMKDIVVLMNTFDGMAHNGGSILSKLVYEESVDRINQGYEFGNIDEKTARITHLMDAKELENPIDVYNKLKHLIETPQNKHLFGDWLARIKRNPEYSQTRDPQKELLRIRIKKMMIRNIQFINLNYLMECKDKVLNIKNNTKLDQILDICAGLRQITRSIMDRLVAMIDDIREFIPQEEPDQVLTDQLGQIQQLCITIKNDMPSFAMLEASTLRNHMSDIIEGCRKIYGGITKLNNMVQEL